MSSALKAHDKVKIFVRAAITPQFFKNNEVEKYAPVVSKIANGNKIIERHLIASLELISVPKPKNFPVMIKQFYDEDALEEETIIEWAEDGRSEYTLDAVDEDTRAALRSEAEPVVVWLQAESDSDSDDEWNPWSNFVFKKTFAPASMCTVFLIASIRNFIILSWHPFTKLYDIHTI